MNIKEGSDMIDSYERYLILSDMDGTLIGSNFKISQKNFNAIRYFIEHGGIFGVATGRTKYSIRPYMGDLKPNGPCILYNGALVYDFEKDRDIKSEFLEKHMLDEYVDHCLKNFENMTVEIFTPEMMYIVSPEGNVDPSVEREKKVFRYSTLAEVSEMDWYKAILFDTGKNLFEAQAALKAFELEERLENVFSQDFYLELLKKNVSKGMALEGLKKLPRFSQKTVIAVGDYDNDIGMIKSADVGIAVRNARACVKQAADIITVSNDEDVMQDIIFNILPALQIKRC